MMSNQTSAKATVVAAASGEFHANPNGTEHAPLGTDEYVNNIQDKVHMLVLETDEPHSETLDRKGCFGEIFNELYNLAGSPSQ